MIYYLRKNMRLLIQIAALVFFLAFWHVCAALWFGNNSVMPTPISALIALSDLLISGQIVDDAFVSLYRVFLGYLIGITFALGIAIISIISWKFRAFITPIIELLRPIPPVAFVPLAILWFGIGDGPSFFLCLLQRFSLRLLIH